MEVHLTNQRYLFSQAGFFNKLSIAPITLSAILGPLSVNLE